MSTITALQETTIYFEQSMRSQLETQETEMRDQLNNQEVDLRGLKIQKSMNDRIVEELRPLCEELPPDALDPVTFEPYDLPLVYRCGHVLNKKTIIKIAKENGLCQGDLTDCPSCKTPSLISQFYDCIPLEGLVQHMQKITDIFQKNTK